MDKKEYLKGLRLIHAVVDQIEIKAAEGNYDEALEIIKGTTETVMQVYKEKKYSLSAKERRELLKPLTEAAQKIHDKMNPLDKKEPMKWQKPIAEKPAKKVNKRITAK